MRTLAVVLALFALSAAYGADPAKTHTSLAKTKNFDIRYRPGSRAGASVDRVAIMAERDLADITEKLAFRPKCRFTMFLYDDETEIGRILGIAVGGASAGTTTHIPHDNGQTRYHEMTHLVTARLPKTGNEPRNMFFPDGIANALLTYVHGVHVHAVAKFYLIRKKLPPLSEMAEGDFYAWLGKRPGFNGYDVGGSWFRYLIDTFGIKKVKRYYGGMPCKKAFGLPRDRIERAWHETLAGFAMREEVETLLAIRDGERKEFTKYVPPALTREEILGKKSDWRSLMDEKLRPRDGTAWAREGDAISATGGGGWHVCDLGTKDYGDCAVRARIRTEGKLTGVQLQLGDGAAGMLNFNALYIYRTSAGTGGSDAIRLPGNADLTLMIVRHAGRLQAWVDGKKYAEGPVDSARHPVGIGFHSGGKVTFLAVEVRALE